MRGFTKRHVACSLLTGAAIGAAVALLYAPQNGAQTRKSLRKFSRRAADQLEDLQDDVRTQINDRYEQVLEVFDNVKEYVEDGKSRLKKMIQTA
jgi:gas vesicle protein